MEITNITRAPLPIVTPEMPLLSGENLSQEQVSETFRLTFQEFCLEYEERIKKAEKGDKEALSRGCWYGNDYMKLLLMNEQGKRFDYLKKKTAVLYGVPPSGFKRVIKAREIEPHTYRIASTIAPSEAFDNLENRISFIDCNMAVQLGVLGTLRKLLSDKQFDTIFALDGPRPLTISRKIELSSIFNLMSFRRLILGLGADGNRLLQKGEVIVFENCDQYSKKHPLGAYSNLNVLASEYERKQCFFGFGLPESGLSELMLTKYMLDAMNKEVEDISSYCTTEVARDIKEQTIELVKNKDLQVTVAEFLACGGGFRNTIGVLSINAPQINSIIESL